MIHEEHNTLAGLITYLNYRKDTGHPAARVTPEQEESWAQMLIDKLGNPVTVCKITVEGNNPLILDAINRTEIMEHLELFASSGSDFEVSFETMPEYKFYSLPEHQGW